MLNHLLRKSGIAPRRSTWIAVALSLLIVAVTSEQARAQLCVQLNGGTYTQNFDTLAVFGTSNDLNSLPIGFATAEAGSGNDNTYAAGNGSSSAGNTYSFGPSGSTERALGELTSTTVQSTCGACFVNNTGSAIMTFVIGYTGEQWRLGDSDAPVDKLDFQYSTNATALNTGAYTDVNELDFSSPNNAAASEGSMNGNAAGNRTVFAPFAITPTTPIAANATFFIRWVPLNLVGANDGLAIDDFLLGYFAPPGLSGDFNSDNEVNAADYTVWRNSVGPGTLANDAGISPGVVDAADYNHWKSRYGISTIPYVDNGSGSGNEVHSRNVPEPSTGFLLLAGGSLVGLAVRHGRVYARR